MRFARDGSETSLDAAMASPRAPFSTRRVVGSSTSGPAPLAVPLHVNSWRVMGCGASWIAGWTMGCSSRRSPRLLHACKPSGMARPLDQRIALLGAHAEMSPLPWLLQWRATVYAVDLPRQDIWHRLLRLVHDGNGTLVAPFGGSRTGRDSRRIDAAGRRGPDRRHAGNCRVLATADGPLTVGAYAYLDSALHVRVSAAMDSIQAQLARSAATSCCDAGHTDRCLCVPAGALKMAHARYARGAWRQS